MVKTTPKNRRDRISSTEPAVTKLGSSKNSPGDKAASFRKYAASVRNGLHESAKRRASGLG